MKAVVTDASPLHYLVLIDQINVLPQLFGEIFVPPTVVEELSRSRTPASVKAWVESSPAWFTVKAPAKSSISLRDRGEADAIALALELDITTILLDDLEPRELARSMGLTVIGTIGILELAADRGVIDDLRATHERLGRTNFRASPHLLEQSLARHLRKQS